MTDKEALKQLIEDLISMMEYHVEQTRTIHTTTVALQAAREALKALAQPEQKPVAKYSDIVSDGGLDPRNTTPPQRTEQEQQIEMLKRCLFQMQEAAKDLVEQAKSLTPPQRAFVGLTEDDKVLIKHDANFNQFMTAGEYADRVQALTEARLKDKNT